MIIDSHKAVRLPARPTVKTPDGSDVRVLSSTSHGSCAHFELAGDQTSLAVIRGTVEEIWYFLSGRGQMWLASANSDGDVLDVMPRDWVPIPVGTVSIPRSWERAAGSRRTTMPQWPGENEASVMDGR